MADKDGKVVQQPYKCNWCGEDLHDRYGRAIYNDFKGRQYCTAYCRNAQLEAEKRDRECSNEA